VTVSVAWSMRIAGDPEIGNSRPNCCSVFDTSLSAALPVRIEFSYYPRCFLTFRRFSECYGFFTFGVRMPNLRPFSESLISVASRC
jgi:hypothetical protein